MKASGLLLAALATWGLSASAVADLDLSLANTDDASLAAWTYDACDGDGIPYFLREPSTGLLGLADYSDEDLWAIVNEGYSHLPYYLRKGAPTKQQVDRLFMYAGRRESLIPVLTYWTQPKANLAELMTGPND